MALGHAHLSTIRAQVALRAADVAQAWLMGRAPEIHPGKVPARVVGILPADQVSSAVLLEHIDSLERVLSAVCGAPVKVHCVFQTSAVPASASPVTIRGASERPQLPLPSAPAVPPALACLPSANDHRVKKIAGPRPALPRSAALHH